jgi:Ser/Thr protein kinase RdoA (MazF antagonist)
MCPSISGTEAVSAMKPYNELTRLGRMRRLRQLAQVALKEYGLTDARLTFLQYEGNLTFRVDTLSPVPVTVKPGPYLQDRYLLRILTSSDAEAAASELTWLAALSGEAGLPVPQPVPTLDGRLLTTIITPGVPHGRIVSLLRWIDGRRLTRGFHPHHLRSLGQVMAQLHEFAASWQPPQGFKRPHWDWDGQLGGRDFRLPLDELVASMPAQYQEPFQVVSRQTKQVMQQLGKGSDVYGLIHADMYPENVLFRGKAVFPIDFEDCGYGYWLWDIGVALCTWPWTEDWYWMREAFLDGYSQVRVLPESQLKHLDLFMAAQYATMVLWSSMFILHDPARRVEFEAWRERDGSKLLRYFERG